MFRRVGSGGHPPPFHAVTNEPKGSDMFRNVNQDVLLVQTLVSPLHGGAQESV